MPNFSFVDAKPGDIINLGNLKVIVTFKSHIYINGHIAQYKKLNNNKYIRFVQAKFYRLLIYILN